MYVENGALGGVSGSVVEALALEEGRQGFGVVDDSDECDCLLTSIDNRITCKYQNYNANNDFS